MHEKLLFAQKVTIATLLGLSVGIASAQANLIVKPSTLEHNSVPVILIDASDAFTSKVVRIVNQGESECGGLPAEYRADCLGQAFSRASKAANRGDYQSSSSLLSVGSRQLRSLARQNADRSAPALSRNGRRYIAVKKEAVAAVNKKAAAIVTETQTKLLRSGSSGRKKVHYQRIAQAVGSTKKIFRS